MPKLPLHPFPFLLLASCSSFSFAFGQQTAVFTPLGDFAGGPFNSSAYALSADGTVVVGGSNGTTGLQAFRWTAAGGMAPLGFLTNAPSRAYGASADGATIAGYSGSFQGNEAFVWTAGGGMLGLGDLPGGNTSSYAYGISGDGSTVVGASSSAVSTSQWVEAFRWDANGGMQPLGVLSGGAPESLAFGASYDGAVIVGRSGGRAFRWDAASGMVNLGGVVGGTGSGEAWGINAAGSVIVGFGGTSAGTEAFRWTASTGGVGLGDLPGGAYYSAALDVSDDGNTIVGYGNNNQGVSDAMLWTPALGMVKLQDQLLSQGATGLTGWTLRRAEGVSADGKTVVGWGVNPSGSIEAFVARFVYPLPMSFCTPGTTSNGCAATISWTGTASATATSGFTLTVSNVEGQKTGLLFYGIDNTGFTPLPWGSGSSFLCVKSPTQRTAAQSSGGTLLQCDGTLSLDWNSFRATTPAALGAPFGAGDTLHAQAWFRDPPAAKSTSLSDALTFVLAP